MEDNDADLKKKRKQRGISKRAGDEPQSLFPPYTFNAFALMNADACSGP